MTRQAPLAVTIEAGRFRPLDAESCAPIRHPLWRKKAIQWRRICFTSLSSTCETSEQHSIAEHATHQWRMCVRGCTPSGETMSCALRSAAYWYMPPDMANSFPPPHAYLRARGETRKPTPTSLCTALWSTGHRSTRHHGVTCAMVVRAEEVLRLRSTYVVHRAPRPSFPAIRAVGAQRAH